MHKLYGGVRQLGEEYRKMHVTLPDTWQSSAGPRGILGIINKRPMNTHNHALPKTRNNGIIYTLNMLLCMHKSAIAHYHACSYRYPT